MYRSSNCTFEIYGMNKKSRTLKIVRSFARKPRASLPLSGVWLEEAGFTIDMRVKVIVKEKCLVIIPLEQKT